MKTVSYWFFILIMCLLKNSNLFFRSRKIRNFLFSDKEIDVYYCKHTKNVRFTTYTPAKAPLRDRSFLTISLNRSLHLHDSGGLNDLFLNFAPDKLLSGVLLPDTYY